MTPNLNTPGGILIPQFAAKLLGSGIIPLEAAHRSSPDNHIAIGSMMYRIQWDMHGKLSEATVRVRAAHALLHDAYLVDPAQLASAFHQVFATLAEVQQRESEMYNAARRATDQNLEEYFGAWFRFYDTTCEFFYRTIGSLYAVAHNIIVKGPDPSTFLMEDGRVGLLRLSQIVEIERGVPSGTFSDGLNSHWRNAAAHHQYTVKSANCVSVWDLSHRSRDYTWGPVDWTHYETVRNLCQLSITCHVLLLGLALFDLHHGPEIHKNHRAPEVKKRRDIVYSECRTAADMHGFKINRVDATGEDTITLKLQVLGEVELDQVQQIMIRTPAGMRMHLQTLRTLTSPLMRQLIGFTQMSTSAHLAYPKMILSVVDRDGRTALGEMKWDRVLRERTFNGEGWETVAASLEPHTIAVMDIPVVVRGALTPVN